MRAWAAIQEDQALQVQVEYWIFEGGNFAIAIGCAAAFIVIFLQTPH